jgi:hypothetical protein
MNGFGNVSLKAVSGSTREQGHHEDALTFLNTDQLGGTVGDRRHPATVRVQLTIELSGVDVALGDNRLPVWSSEHEDNGELKVP